MVKYVILVWNEDNMSDIRVLRNPSNNEARVFEIHVLAKIHARTKTRNLNYQVVEIPIIEE